MATKTKFNGPRPPNRAFILQRYRSNSDCSLLSRLSSRYSPIWRTHKARAFVLLTSLSFPYAAESSEVCQPAPLCPDRPPPVLAKSLLVVRVQMTPYTARLTDLCLLRVLASLFCTQTTKRALLAISRVDQTQLSLQYNSRVDLCLLEDCSRKCTSIVTSIVSLMLNTSYL